jgi:large subunit ribosomal protein L31e
VDALEPTRKGDVGDREKSKLEGAWVKESTEKTEGDEAETTDEREEPEEVEEEEKATEEIVEAVEETEAEGKMEVEAPRKKEVAEEIVEEKVYTIPLGRAWVSPRQKRAPRAIRLVKSFIQRHMKVREEALEEGEEGEKVVISNEVNEKIWSRGIQKPPRRIRVRVTKDKDRIITIYLAEGD